MGLFKRLFRRNDENREKNVEKRQLKNEVKDDGSLEQQLQDLEDKGQGLASIIALLKSLGINIGDIMIKLDKSGVSKERIMREMIDYVEKSGVNLSDIFKKAEKQGYKVDELIVALSIAGVPQAKINKAYAESGLVTDSKNPETYESISKVAKRGDHDEVIRLATEAIDSGKIDTNSLSMYYDLRSNAYRDKGMIDKAIEDTELVKHMITSQFPPEALNHPAIKDAVKQIETKLVNLRAKKAEQ